MRFLSTVVIVVSRSSALFVTIPSPYLRLFLPLTLDARHRPSHSYPRTGSRLVDEFRVARRPYRARGLGPPSAVVTVCR